MRLKRIFTTGEQAVFRIAKEVAAHHGVEAIAKVRLADAIHIENSGISGYALRAHFDVLVIQNNLPLLALEFDGSGHDPRKDDLKNKLCDRFELPLVRVNMAHVNGKNFEDSAVHFFLFQWFGVNDFLKKYGTDPYEIYDPLFFVSVPGKDREFPFAYEARWRGRLKRQFQQHSGVFEGRLKDLYEGGLLNWAGGEGVWREATNFEPYVPKASVLTHRSSVLSL
jgi:hypothetical protein